MNSPNFCDMEFCIKPFVCWSHSSSTAFFILYAKIIKFYIKICTYVIVQIENIESIQHVIRVGRYVCLRPNLYNVVFWRNWIKIVNELKLKIYVLFFIQLLYFFFKKNVNVIYNYIWIVVEFFVLFNYILLYKIIYGSLYIIIYNYI